MDPDLLQGFYLRDLLVIPPKGEISDAAGKAHLPPKSMEVLLCLASNPGELVTRDRLIETAWGKGRGSQEALNHAISEIRHALNDDSDDPRFVQTLPKRGYRLIVEPVPHSAQTSTSRFRSTGRFDVDDIGLFENLRQRGVLETAIAYLVVGWLIIQIVDIVFDQLLLPQWAGTFVTVLVIAGFPIAIAVSWFLEFRDGRAVVHELSPRDAMRRRFSRTYLSIIGAMGIAAIAVFIYDRSIGLPDITRTASAPATTESVLPPILANTIAVLPFSNLDGSEETGVFASGLADDVITRLSRVPGLLVSSRGDAFTLAPNSPSQRVRERLRVARYIEGSVQLAGERMRIIMQLINSETGFHILSRSFDRGVEDFFDIRDEITELVVANVRVALPPETQAASVFPDDDPSLDAYMLYRRGAEILLRPRLITSTIKAIEWFDAALEIDPDYAAAHAGKCSAFVDAYYETDDSPYIAKAHGSCASALALNPNLDVVHTALGNLYFETGEYERAEAAYLKALDILPTSVAALTGLGETYTRLLDPVAAEAHFRKAVGLHPGDWSAYNSLGVFLFRSGRYEEAVTEWEKVVRLDNENSTGYSNLGAAHMLVGNFAAAVQALQKSIELAPDANSYSNLGLMHYYLGQLSEAISSHEEAIKLTPNNHLRWSNLGDALWIAGRIDDAREAFEKAERLATRALEVNRNDPYNHIDLAWIYAMLDKYADARVSIERALDAELDDPYVHYIDGLVLLRIGNTDAALSALELAADMGYSLQIMAAEPHLAPIRENPRFRAILDRI